jgi:hypothetical protein
MADESVLMALGDFRFSLSTAAHQTLARKTAWRWEAVERVGRRPARQYLGPGDDTITLSGVQFTAWRGGTGQVEAMRAQAAKGTPLALVDGEGNVFGLWVILSVDESQSGFIAGGLPRKQEWTLSLAAYGEDQ